MSNKVNFPEHFDIRGNFQIKECRSTYSPTSWKIGVSPVDARSGMITVSIVSSGDGTRRLITLSDYEAAAIADRLQWASDLLRAIRTANDKK